MEVPYLSLRLLNLLNQKSTYGGEHAIFLYEEKESKYLHESRAVEYLTTILQIKQKILMEEGGFRSESNCYRQWQPGRGGHSPLKLVKGAKNSMKLNCVIAIIQHQVAGQCVKGCFCQGRLNRNRHPGHNFERIYQYTCSNDCEFFKFSLSFFFMLLP